MIAVLSPELGPVGSDDDAGLEQDFHMMELEHNSHNHSHGHLQKKQKHSCKCPNKPRMVSKQVQYDISDTLHPAHLKKKQSSFPQVVIPIKASAQSKSSPSEQTKNYPKKSSRASIKSIPTPPSSIATDNERTSVRHVPPSVLQPLPQPFNVASTPNPFAAHRVPKSQNTLMLMSEKARGKQRAILTDSDDNGDDDDVIIVEPNRSMEVEEHGSTSGLPAEEVVLSSDDSDDDWTSSSPEAEDRAIYSLLLRNRSSQSLSPRRPSPLQAATSPQKRKAPIDFEIRIESSSSSKSSPSPKKKKLSVCTTIFRHEHQHIVDEADLVEALDEDKGANKVDLPVRYLSGFSFINSKTGRQASLLELYNKKSSSQYQLEGIASPKHERATAEARTNHSAHTRISKFASIIASGTSLWVESPSAWYELRQPHKSYATEFESEALRLVALFVAARAGGFRRCLRDQVNKIKEHIKNYTPAKNSGLPLQLIELTPKLGPRDVDSFCDQLDAALLGAKNNLELAPIFVSSSVYRTIAPYFAEGELKQPFGSEAENDAAVNEEQEEVEEIITRMSEMLRAWDSEQECRVDVTKESRDFPRTWDKAFVGGYELGSGDCVAVAPDKYDFTGDCRNPPWFARIKYFEFDRHDVLQAHLHWFEHGSQVAVDDGKISKKVFGKAADPRQLFLIDHCSSHDASTLLGKIVVRRQNGDERPPRGYFYRYAWDKDPSQLGFRSPSEVDGCEPTPLCERNGVRPCACCERRFAEKDWARPTYIFKEDDANLERRLAFRYEGVNYGIGSDCFIFTDRGSVFEVGRLTHINGRNLDNVEKKGRAKLTKKAKVTVTYWRRLPDLVKDPAMDDRRLVWTNTSEEFDISSLKGVATVRHDMDLKVSLEEVLGQVAKEVAKEDRSGELLEEVRERTEALKRSNYLRFPCTFIASQQYMPSEPRSLLQLFSQPDSLYAYTYAQHQQTSCTIFDTGPEKLSTQVANAPTLKYIDLFSGPGGFSEGLEQSGMKAVASVEFDETAARVFRLNHPHAKVFIEDVSVVATELCARSQGQKYDEKYDSIPLTVDACCGSPPCCPHSCANWTRDAQDTRIHLPFTMVSITEILQADYYMAENVPNVVNSPLVVEGELWKGAAFGLWVQCLLNLGFQITWGVVRADSHGVPQTRNRFFMMGAKLGKTLPQLPATSTLLLRGGESDWQERSAPHKPITFDDATSDLPPFEMRPPSIRVDFQTPSSPRPHIPSFDHGTIDRSSPQAYTQAPQTAYQTRMRINEKVDLRHEGAPLSSHNVAKMQKSVNVERIWRIPKVGCHYDLPQSLALKPYSSGKPKNVRFLHSDPCSSLNFHCSQRSWFARIDGARPLGTLIRTVDTNGGSHGACIHPHQHRLISCREAMRIQGFPDSYNFDPEGLELSATHKYALIGNAVSPIVSFAIGRELQRSRFETPARVKFEDTEDD
ncbi:S-adenosyl-L-methionine-dependent methyltransferase [Meredithblackwellia eburnea MCA 4105]